MVDQNKFKDIWGVVLAGGKSSRMGENKALLQLKNGKSFLDNAVAILSCHLDNCFVSCANKSDYPGYPVISDEMADLGPAAGIFSCLQKASISGASAIMALACDLPLFNSSLLKKLLTAHINFSCPFPLVTVWENPFSGHLEMTCAVYAVECLPFFKKSIEQKKLALYKIIPENKIQILKPNQTEKKFFANCNTKEDYFKILEDG